jgi:hypothetical protein
MAGRKMIGKPPAASRQLIVTSQRSNETEPYLNHGEVDIGRHGLVARTLGFLNTVPIPTT